MYEPVSPESALHVKHRETARAFVTNPGGQLLLIKTHWDPGTGLPPRWLTPGGGIDQGESVADAAKRELWEELGLEVSQGMLQETPAQLDFKITWADSRYETGRAYFFRILVDSGFVPDTSNWTQDEHRDVLELRWWNVQDILNSQERFGPPGLKDLIRLHFAS